MRHKLLIFLLTSLLSISFLPAQNMSEALTQGLAKEGEILYNLERLTRASAEYLYANGGMTGLRGYLSYEEEGIYKCVYWNGAYDNLGIVYTFSSGNPEISGNLDIDSHERKLTEKEQLLYDIKMEALLYIKSDPIFKAPEGTQLSLSFVEDKKWIKGYVRPITGDTSFIPLGNDYVFFYTKKGELDYYTQLHPFARISNIQAPDEQGKVVTIQTLSDKKRPYLLPTEICNLLLYSSQKELHVHFLITETYISTYSLKDKSLSIQLNVDADK